MCSIEVSIIILFFYSFLRPDGYLYDKMSIIEYMVHQKRDIAKKLKEYERQLQKDKVCNCICIELLLFDTLSILP